MTIHRIVRAWPENFLYVIFYCHCGGPIEVLFVMAKERKPNITKENEQFNEKKIERMEETDTNQQC